MFLRAVFLFLNPGNRVPASSELAPVPVDSAKDPRRGASTTGHEMEIGLSAGVGQGADENPAFQDFVMDKNKSHCPSVQEFETASTARF